VLYNIEIVKDIPRFPRRNAGKDKEYIYLFSENADRTSIVSRIDDTPNHLTWYEEKYGPYFVPRRSQARIRGLHNAYPVTTLFNKHNEQWSDKLFEAYRYILDDDIQQIMTAYGGGQYRGIKILDREFGNDNMSRMKYVAPRCYKYLTARLQDIGIDNESLQGYRE